MPPLFTGCALQQVFPQNIKFYVHSEALFYATEVGMRVGVRDDGDGKLIIRDIESGKADPIDAYRAFFNNQCAKRSGEPEAEQPAAIERLLLYAGGGSIYVALYKMAIEAVAYAQRTLYVYLIARQPIAQGGLGKRFGNGGNHITASLYSYYCKANAVVGNALIDLKLRSERAFDSKIYVGTLVANSGN